MRETGPSILSTEVPNRIAFLDLFGVGGEASQALLSPSGKVKPNGVASQKAGGPKMLLTSKLTGRWKPTC